MKISVIIPTYKPQDYLWSCLNSLASQTFPKEDFEVVLILNGCVEPYKTEIEQYLQSQKNGMHVNLICTEQPGVSNARNIGINSAQGEYITFVDDDDLVSPNYLENLYAISSPTCIGCANSYSFTTSVDELSPNRLTHAHEKVSKSPFSLSNYRQFLSPPYLKLIHRTIIGDERFNTGMKISEDALFCAAISKNIKDMKCAPADTIYYIKIREGSATHRKLSFGYILGLTIKKIFLFWKIYFKSPFKYNFPFFITRTLACIKHFEVLLKNSRKY